ncbi:alpha/beta family hydrolase [Synechococcus sp. RSCCF101]|uniref:alpha/beta family hydrolase n=1 Tax=Synechococcus sp. RSCCF101 TaxID=2511069 RepID=UPI001CD9DE8C|nr:alpha/beta family hydrolase [Synechococcus sp. RSCCF101]
MTASRLVDGPEQAPATLLLAHGAGAPMDSPFMAGMAEGLAGLGWRVVRFEFPYMTRQRLSGRRAAPDRMPKLMEAFRQQVALEQGGAPLIIGGKSMGGRVASLLADELAVGAGVLGCCCLGYPFHPIGKPQQTRLEHLQPLRTPTLIVQGERDGMGRRSEVEAYGLSDRVTLHWITDGDHSFKPSRRSGLSEAGNRAEAVSAVDRFGHSLLKAPC